MNENQELPSEITSRPGERFGYLREQYGRHRKEVEADLLKTKHKKGSKVFRSSRKRFARKFFEKEQQGERDELTGLLNRAGFRRRLEEEIARAKRNKTPLTALYVDLNKVKETNDTKGHEAGDNLIKNAARVLQESARSFDVVSRLGGDEFVIVLENAGQEGGEKYWNRVNTAFQSGQLTDLEGNVTYEFLPISSAAGLCVIDYSDPKLVDESFKLADLAMYKSKAITKATGVNTLQTAPDLTPDEIMRGKV